MKLSVGILGATGFTGVELIRLLVRHPGVEIAWISSESQPGTPYAKVYPSLASRLPEAASILISMQAAHQTTPDAVFSCLPHAASAGAIEPFLKNGKTRVIDLSADYRLTDLATYETTYAHKHPHPERLEKAVYGLAEINRQHITGATLVANPGCYPTSVLLPLIPLLREGIVLSTNLIADSKSGVSGAGRKATEGTHFVFVNENFSAYKVAGEHRHLPEIAEQLSLASAQNGGSAVAPLFTPHLVPMERGILSTIYADLAAGKTAADVEACWNKVYGNMPFVRPVKDLPQTADVTRTNECRFAVRQAPGTQKVIIVSVLDNMVKGASGQALQNFNIMFGIEETLGLH